MGASSCSSLSVRAPQASPSSRSSAARSGSAASPPGSLLVTLVGVGGRIGALGATVVLFAQATHTQSRGTARDSSLRATMAPPPFYGGTPEFDPFRPTFQPRGKERLDEPRA